MKQYSRIYLEYLSHARTSPHPHPHPHPTPPHAQESTAESQGWLDARAERMWSGKEAVSEFVPIQFKKKRKKENAGRHRWESDMRNFNLFFVSALTQYTMTTVAKQLTGS